MCTVSTVLQVALDGLARLFCMPYEQLEQSRQRRRQQKREQNMISMTETNSHGSRRKKDKVTSHPDIMTSTHTIGRTYRGSEQY